MLIMQVPAVPSSGIQHQVTRTYHQQSRAALAHWHRGLMPLPVVVLQRFPVNVEACCQLCVNNTR